jgi:hypothetical protein
MAQQKNSNKASQESKKPQTQKKNNDDPKTFGKEPPMVEPTIPEPPDQYEVSGDENQPDQNAKPTLH